VRDLRQEHISCILIVHVVCTFHGLPICFFCIHLTNHHPQSYLGGFSGRSPRFARMVRWQSLCLLLCADSGPQPSNSTKTKSKTQTSCAEAGPLIISTIGVPNSVAHNRPDGKDRPFFEAVKKKISWSNKTVCCRQKLSVEAQSGRPLTSQ